MLCEYEAIENPKAHRIHLNTYRKRSKRKTKAERMTETEMADAYAVQIEAESGNPERANLIERKFDETHVLIHLADTEIEDL